MLICELAGDANIMPAIAMTRLAAIIRKCLMSILLVCSLRLLNPPGNVWLHFAAVALKSPVYLSSSSSGGST